MTEEEYRWLWEILRNEMSLQPQSSIRTSDFLLGGYEIAEESGSTIVKNEAEDKYYAVILSFKHRKWSCGCTAYKFNKGAYMNNKRPCKHILHAAKARTDEAIREGLARLISTVSTRDIQSIMFGSDNDLILSIQNDVWKVVQALSKTDWPLARYAKFKYDVLKEEDRLTMHWACSGWANPI